MINTDLHDKKIKMVAFYLPQFHAIPENNKWWGEGFTEWTHVKKAKPLFPGHNQPRVPLNNYYYDLSRPTDIEWQVDLAKSYGIYGFCHYHYWFDGKQLLETPTNLFLSSKHLDLKFCLAWANESWTRRWDGQDNQALQLQTHEPSKESWGKHFDYLIHAWIDERSIKINDKPVFIIYRPHKIQQIGNMFDYWQTRALKYGLDGIHFLAMKQFAFPDLNWLDDVDGIVHFQPFDAMHILSMLAAKDTPFAKEYNFYRKVVRFLKRKSALIPKPSQELIKKIRFFLRNNYGKPRIFDYDQVWKQIIVNTKTLEEGNCPGAFIDWDNTARYGRRADIFSGSSPVRFEYWLTQLMYTIKENSKCEPIVFINAWNEWSEGTYLEPDEKNNYAYLTAIKKSLETTSRKAII